MKRWSRRRFLAASAATACVGCTSGDDAVSIDSGEIVSGLPLGTVIVDRPTTGPSCVGSSDH